MDKISVSATGLKDAYLALNSFKEQTEAVTAQCEKFLLASSDKLDDTFRNDVAAYLAELKKWSGRVTHYTEENQDAILQRMRALAEYCDTTYSKRNA